MLTSESCASSLLHKYYSSTKLKFTTTYSAYISVQMLVLFIPKIEVLDRANESSLVVLFCYQLERRSLRSQDGPSTPSARSHVLMHPFIYFLRYKYILVMHAGVYHQSEKVCNKSRICAMTLYLVSRKPLEEFNLNFSELRCLRCYHSFFFFFRVWQSNCFFLLDL